VGFILSIHYYIGVKLTRIRMKEAAIVCL